MGTKSVFLKKARKASLSMHFKPGPKGLSQQSPQDKPINNCMWIATFLKIQEPLEDGLRC
jgi:hypothetical protein